MSHAPVPAPTRAALLAVLRAAFAEEVRERVPRLKAAVHDLGAGGGVAADGLRDVHTLASSAAVIGEPELAASLLAVEHLLSPPNVQAPASPVEVADALRHALHLLAEWRP